MWGPLLGGLAQTLIPFAAKKLAQLPIANTIFKTISPIMSTVVPQISKAFQQNQKTQPVVVIQKQTYQQPQSQQRMSRPRKYGKKLKKNWGRRTY